jgi:hypothetical protein
VFEACDAASDAFGPSWAQLTASQRASMAAEAVA